MAKAKALTPGAALKKQLDLYNLSISQFAEGIKISPSAARGIVTGKIRISVQTAQRLSKYFGKTPGYWINLQTAYDLAESSADKQNAVALKSITKAVKVPAKTPIKKAPVIKKGTKKASPGRPRTKKD
ncbi:transcriptional regulator [Spirochaetia bacterium]|nr:transcriptional regulator [Spirochaetia bacterium]